MGQFAECLLEAALAGLAGLGAGDAVGVTPLVAVGERVERGFRGVARGKVRIRTWRRLGAASPKPASAGYIDWNGVKSWTGLPAKFALSSALGSPRSSPETEPVALIASMNSLMWARCSMS